MQWLLAIAALALLSRRPSESTAGAPQAGSPQAGSPQADSPQAGALKTGSGGSDVEKAVVTGVKLVSAGAAIYKTVVTVGGLVLGAVSAQALVIIAPIAVFIVIRLVGAYLEPAMAWRARREWYLTTDAWGGPAWLGRQLEVACARALILGRESSLVQYGPVHDGTRDWGEEKYVEAAWNGRAGLEHAVIGEAVVFARRTRDVALPSVNVFGVRVGGDTARLYDAAPPKDAYDYYDWLAWRRGYPSPPPQEWVDGCAAVAQSVADGAWLGAAVAVALGEGKPLPGQVTVEVYGPGVPRGVFAGATAAENLPRIQSAHAAGYIRRARQVYREWTVEGGGRKFDGVPPEVFETRIAEAYQAITGAPLEVGNAVA
jgi:hypothetical protein